jgi:sialate O-acetylesterase
VVFRFASSQGDGMVLQASPSLAMVWGFCPTGTASVTVRLGADTTVHASINGSVWAAQLPPTPSSMTDTHTITATAGDATISLREVLFGDVWVCSGQVRQQHDALTPSAPPPYPPIIITNVSL